MISADFFKLIPGSYKSNRNIDTTRNDKNHSKCDCFDGSIVNGIRDPILYNLALNKPPGDEFFKEPRIKLYKKLKKSVLSHITLYLEDDDRKVVDFIY